MGNEFIHRIKRLFLDVDSVFDSWLNRKLNAYGWRGFVASLVVFGTAYLIMFFLPEIAGFFGAEKHTPDQELTYQARMVVINKIYSVIFILLVLKLVSQYSKKNKVARKEEMRKVALMEAEIIERKFEQKK